MMLSVHPQNSAGSLASPDFCPLWQKERFSAEELRGLRGWAASITANLQVFQPSAAHPRNPRNPRLTDGYAAL
jgi:hypothetical protein